MKVNDLTHIISSNMPVFPGTEQPVLEKVSTIGKDGFRESKITMCSHIGTHVDSTAHMLDDGKYLDELSIENFIGSAIIVDFSNQNKNLIEISDLKLYDEKINQVDFIILKTGWSKYWGQSNYYKGFPSLSEECAKWLSEFNLKGIGIDAISIDSIDSKTFLIHKILMKKNIIIIENLTNLDSIINESFILSIMPLKNKDADGSPVRAISIENI